MWWRDDDAAAPCDRLDRLLAIAGEAPVALAVIPMPRGPRSRAWLDGTPRRSGGASSIAILQHGWRHADHAVRSKKSEFPAERSGGSVTADLAAGRERLRELFGARALAVLAPPWNRFAEAFLPLLAGCGIGAISQVNPRGAAWPAPGAFAANVHVDLVAWCGGPRLHRRSCGAGRPRRAFAGAPMRRSRWRGADRDPDPPPGSGRRPRTISSLRLVALTAAHPSACWLDAGEVFAPGLEAAATFASGDTAPT